MRQPELGFDPALEFRSALGKSLLLELDDARIGVRVAVSVKVRVSLRVLAGVGVQLLICVPIPLPHTWQHSGCHWGFSHS